MTFHSAPGLGDPSIAEIISMFKPVFAHPQDSQHHNLRVSEGDNLENSIKNLMG